ECFSGMVGHGTHVAGIVGASTHNGIGVAGICVDCSLIIAKIRQGNNAFSSSIINGIYHGIIRGAQVINRSGGSYYIEGAHGAGKHNCSDVAGDDGFCLVLALAERREVVLVAASGNNNNATMGTEFPAREPNVVSVAGTTYPNDDLWASDQNPCCAGSDTTKVDFVAPAKRVMSTFYPGGSWAPANCSDILNDGNNGFDECTGTSMAAPHVAATIAVVRSVNPLLSRYAVVDLVRQSARTVAISSTYPNGFKMPSHVDGVIAAHYTNGSITPVFAMANVESSVAWNRYFTVAPQMAVAGITGTMLPTLNGSSTPVYYIPDQNAPVVSGYALPDAGRGNPERISRSTRKWRSMASVSCRFTGLVSYRTRERESTNADTHRRSPRSQSACCTAIPRVRRKGPNSPP
ncbi:MAG: S8 family serine peptidase, partial [Betaproteobacteria bacterium]